jgi:multiple sugar transport system ATP-binding protein
MSLKIVAGGVKFGNATLKINSAVLSKTKEKSITVGLRPEDLVISKKDGIQVEIDVIEELGADAFLYGSAVIEGKKTDVIARIGSISSLRSGDKVYLKPQGGITHLFDVASGERLNNDAPAVAKKAVAAKPAAKKVAAKKPASKPAAKKAAAKPTVKKAAAKKTK